MWQLLEAAIEAIQRKDEKSVSYEELYGCVRRSGLIRGFFPCRPGDSVYGSLYLSPARDPYLLHRCAHCQHFRMVTDSSALSESSR